MPTAPHPEAPRLMLDQVLVSGMQRWCPQRPGTLRPALVQPLSLLPSVQPRRLCRARVPLVAGYVLLAIVLLLVGAVFVLAVGLVMPALFSPLQLLLAHVPMAALLAFNTLL